MQKEFVKILKFFLVNIISDALLLVDVFENFRKMSLKIHELNPVRFLSAPELIGKQL